MSTDRELPDITGVRLATAETGTRYNNRPDLLLAIFDPGTTVAGVLTRSTTAAAPVDWCRARLAAGRAGALVVNAGNANAFTGAEGMAAAETIAEMAGDAAGVARDEVFLASTGVIGEPLAPGPITSLLAALAKAAGPGGWDDAARAITTTDTTLKRATRTARIGDNTVTLNGIAKGSGMIAPNMATMLAFLFTDAALPAPVLQALLTESANKSFNSITVDSDTSTSDTVLLFATGAGGGGAGITRADDPQLAEFAEALDAVSLDLAHQIVRDGEGAKKFISIRVTGAEDNQAARRIAFAIANSPLVKTAIAGEDANWGRIVMAVGKAGEKADRNNLEIRIGGVQVTRDGAVDPGYREQQVADHLKGRDIDIEVDVAIGGGAAQVWTCDLTHGYIDINADYRS